MGHRKNISSGSPYEASIGFSRASRIGNIISVAGTAPLAADGSTAAPGDVYGQTYRCLEIIESAIQEVGGSLSNVIRTRCDADRHFTMGRGWAGSWRIFWKRTPCLYFCSNFCLHKGRLAG